MSQNTSLHFILEAKKLFAMPKKGWILIEVKNPETVTQHTFRVAIMAWFFGQSSGKPMNIEYLLKIALGHDLCEVYAGDTTPYDDNLPLDKKEWPELFDAWPRYLKEKKIERFLKKHQKEQESLLKLGSFLPPAPMGELLALWLSYQQGLSRESRFARQINRAETLLQALEYSRAMKKRPFQSWWIGSKELIDDPQLVLFMEELDHVFNGGKKPGPLLNFFLNLGKLKRLPRRGWVVRGIKNPETIADHTFMVALMTWVLGKSYAHELDMERVLKMSLIHEICAVHAGDYTPHDIFSKGLGKWFKAWGQKPRLEQEERQRLFLETYKKETKALQKLIQNLPVKLKNEILELWSGFVEKRCREADFVDQVNCLATYLQALEYWRKDQKFPIHIFAENAAHFVHDPSLLEFFKEINAHFAFEEKRLA